MPKVHALGTRFRKVQIGQPTIAFSKNNVVRLELPNGLIQKHLIFRLTGNLVVGTANAANIFSEAPLGLIRKIELVGDGRRYLCSADARDLWHLSRRMYRKKTELAAPSGTVGTRAFSAAFMLDADAMNFADPSESMLDTRIFKKLELVVTWGSETDIATAGGGGGTIAIDAATALDVLAVETSEGIHKILFDHVLASNEVATTATSTDMLLADVPQSGLLAGFMVRVTRDAGAGAGPVPVDDVINNLSLVSDVSIKHIDKAKWRTLQAKEVAQFLIDGGDATTGQEVGYAYVDLSENGMFSSALNINALNKAQLRADVTRTSGTELIHILFDFFEPRGDASAEAAVA